MNKGTRNLSARKKANSSRDYAQAFLKPLFDAAVAHHGVGRFQQAKELYLQVLSKSPQHSDTLHLLGILSYQQGELHSAFDYITRAIQIQDDKPLYFFNLGLVHQKLTNVEEAIGAYRRAIELKPNYEEAYTNLGNVLRSKGDLTAAIMAYREALRVKPDSSSGYNNLGVALKEQGHRNEAIKAYRTAVRLNSKNAEAHCNLGIGLLEQNHFDEAFHACQEAVHIRPGYAKAQHNLGLVLLAQGHPESALLALRASADATRNHGQSVNIQKILPSRVKHDAEQMAHLERQGISFSGLHSFRQTLQSLMIKSQASEGTNVPLDVTVEESQDLAPSFSRILHYADASRISQGTLNPELDVSEVERRYHANHPEMVTVDDLLRKEAIQALRKFCWESTIWKKDYENGYIGTMLGEGFSCPLLLQIASELRETFRGIFQHHQLLQAWAFKQDGRLKPLNIHADAAAVNVNFWITQNEANLDPSCGGLIVWDKEAPKDWNFALYNSSKYKPRIMEFLQAHEAKRVVVPYRENRALIFNSDLFHESDRCEFRDEYIHRRINITFLYGHRNK